MSLQTASTSLPVLALPADILFPATQLTVNLPRALLNPLTYLIRDVADSGATPLVVAVPSSEPIVNAKDLDGIKLHEWGCGKPCFDNVILNSDYRSCEGNTAHEALCVQPFLLYYHS
jgi:hypothetical protein